ncbi:cyclic nucleotide-binding domain-containing protein [Nocardia sp. ET3-3]|uniref:Cyclic nucleotide-binding domain-containing protein n=1 Tax=Nocardia terrae TaxID=2675851 RepID=A0A7K1V5N3_9NOCA|nr:Crp/Fnr family transcriptional regulator [Nocardia terrae]MVU81963.1 cyclic nucleotide-binding domain-containing protein [Nocardia terrae]
MVQQDWPAGTLMARLSPASRARLLELGRPVLYEPGEVLMRQGREGSSVYLLRAAEATTSACVKITAGDHNGDRTLFAILVSGDVVGELGALEPNSMRSATATACSRTLAHKIPGGLFLDFLDDHPDAWQALCRTIVSRLAWSDQRRLDFAGYGVPVRLARVLLELVAAHGCSTEQGWVITVKLSVAELGDLIGAKEDALGLALSRLRKLELVSRPANRHRQLIVTDLDGLHAFADLA